MKGLGRIVDFEEKIIRMMNTYYACKHNDNPTAEYGEASKVAQEARNALIEYVEKLEKYAKEMETIIVAKSC